MKNSSLWCALLIIGASFIGVACAVPSAKTILHETSIATPVAEKEIFSAKKKSEEPLSGAPVADQSSSLQALKIVRVLLADNQSSTKIEHSGRVYVYTQNLDKKYKISDAGTLTIRFTGTNTVQVGTLSSTQPIIVEPAKNTLLTWNGNIYAGRFVFLPQQHTFLLVEHTDLENYLYGVLPYEMSYSWPIEALKAQAVAARTYTLKTLENSKGKYFDLYSDVRSQMYKGGGKQYPSVKEAVDNTKSQVLTFNDKLFYTYYHGNCGGGTDDITSWNPYATSIKPLSGAKCTHDKHSKSFAFKQDIPYAKISAYLHSIGLSGTLKSIKVAKHTSTGRAITLNIRTSKGIKNVSCNKFRMATGLRSCKLTKLQFSGKTLHTAGHGYGHGIGMCQDGANGMARDKKTYKQILKNYYPGAEITTLTK